MTTRSVPATGVIPARPPRGLVLAVITLTLITRIRALLSSQSDPNVGVYYYIAHLWLHGALPYVAAWEYKPPGLFAVCAAGLLLFRDTATASSVLGAIAVIAAALSAYVIVVSNRVAGSPTAGIVAAFFVVSLSTENAGLLSDAKLFVNAWIGVAFAFVLARPGWSGVLAGSVAAAAAVQMKLTAAPMLLAIGATLIFQYGPASIAFCTAYAAIVALPFALEALLYLSFHALPAFVDANVSATLRRAFAVRHGARTGASLWVRELRLFSPALELGVFAFARPSRNALVPVLWLVAAGAAIAGASEYYDRHFVLLIPPISIFGALGVERIARLGNRRFRPAIVATVLIGTFLLHGYYEAAQGLRVAYHRFVLGQSDWQTGDYTVVLAALRQTTHGDPSFFAIQISPDVYEDLHVVPPTRYPFTGNLLDGAMWPMIGFSGGHEFERILATRPHFIACGPLETKVDPASAALLRGTLARDYTFVREERNVRIYELRSLAAEPHQPRT
jgi:hypothetical protein